MANRVVLAFNSTYGFAESLAAGDNLDLQSTGKIVNLAAGASSGDALSYGQSGASLAGLTLTADLAMGTYKVTGLGTPSSSTDAATKGYVDSAINGLKWVAPVAAVATTRVLSLSGTTTIDGVSLSAGNRVLLTSQQTIGTSNVNNGIWVVQSGSWTRPDDFATGNTADGVACFVEQGTSYADSGWVCSTNSGSAVIGTDALAFVQFSTAGTITASHGLVKSGSDIQANPGDGLTLDGTNTYIQVSLPTIGAGLALSGSSPTKTLNTKVDSSGGLTTGSGGLAVSVDTTTSGNPTVAVGSNGLRVIGLPSQFTIGGSLNAVSTNVTASNLNTLTGGASGDASSLHSHKSGPVFTAASSSALSAGDPVYWSSTNDKLDKAEAGTDAKSFVCGLNNSSSVLANGNARVVSMGYNAGVLSSATAGTVYYLQASGGIGTTVPSGGNNVVQVGFAINATDLFVMIQRFGKA
jgi:hypothetical protein